MIIPDYILGILSLSLIVLMGFSFYALIAVITHAILKREAILVTDPEYIVLFSFFWPITWVVGLIIYLILGISYIVYCIFTSKPFKYIYNKLSSLHKRISG